MVPAAGIEPASAGYESAASPPMLRRQKAQAALANAYRAPEARRPPPRGHPRFNFILRTQIATRVVVEAGTFGLRGRIRTSDLLTPNQAP